MMTQTHHDVYLAVQRGLQEFLSAAFTTPDYQDLLVIEANPDAPEPKRPFVVINFTTVLIPEAGQAVTTWEPKGRDVEEEHITNPTKKLSLTVFSDIQGQDTEIAEACFDWFERSGEYYLEEHGIVVSDLGSVENRDVYLIDQTDRKVGFDVTLRVSRLIYTIVKAIETVEIEKKEVF